MYLYFNILLLLSYFLYLLYTVNQFSFTHFRYCVSTFSYKHMPQCKFSLYLKKAGLASRNIVHFLKKVILRCIGLCFNYHLGTRMRVITCGVAVVMSATEDITAMVHTRGPIARLQLMFKT